MLCFVTGASGFIGANLVHELVARGHDVRALLRPQSDARGLAGVPFERVEGDVSDRFLLRKLLRGCDWCFHAAGSYHLWLPDYRPMYAVNVQGTRNVLDAAAKAGCRRIVYTSTAACVGHARIVQGEVIPADEAASVSEQDMPSHYARSKWQAEQAALELAAHGVPVVIVNPSAPLGPRDVRPTPTGKFVLDFLNRRMPAFIDTGLSWVHVRDVATGHILAAEKGRLGERYILSHAEGNWTMQQTLLALEEITGLPATRFRIPYGLALAAAYANQALARLTGQPPRAPLDGVRMAKNRMFFKPDKAIRELGLPQTPPKQALADAVDWFLAHGYAAKPRGSQ